MFSHNMKIADFDRDLSQALKAESRRQEEHIELIASENYASPRVLEAQGSALTNKYAEGYPGARYYGGCEHVDVVESLAIERLKKLFGADWANVQPHSGSQANLAAFLSVLVPGDCILGMKIDHGGHLTHGSKVSFSGKGFNAVQYGVDGGGLIDYDEVQRLASEHRPKLVIAGFSAYSRVIDWQRFREIADSVDAVLMADIAHVSGLIAADQYPSPVPFADIVTSTTHKTLRGPRSGIIFGRENPDIERKVNNAVFPALQGGPLLHAIAGKAVAFAEAREPEFKEYQRQVVANSRAFASRFLEKGYQVVSGGTDNHMFLLSLIDKELSGREACDAIGRANITANMNMVPNDPRPPRQASGLRLGTPAVTTRGFKEAEVRQVADWVCRVLQNPDSDSELARVRAEVIELCRAFPVYGS